MLLPAVALADPFDDACTGEVRRTPTAWTCTTPDLHLQRATGPDQPPPADERCRGNGTALRAAADVPVEAVCAWLATDALQLAPVRAPPPPATPWPQRLPLRPFALLALVAGLALLGRDRAAWGWIGAALVARLLLSPRRILMGMAYPYERMLMYAGEQGPSQLYGRGWVALTGIFRPALPDPTALHDVDLVLSVLTAGWVYVAARAVWDDAKAGHLAAATWSLAPHALALARTETHFVACAALTALALAGLARPGRVGDVALGLAAGVLLHTRPLQGPAVAVLLGAALVSRRAWPAVLATALGAVRLAELWPRLVTEGLPSGTNVWSADPAWIVDHVAGRGAALALFDPWVTPVWIPVGLGVVVVLAAREDGPPRSAVAVGALGLLAASIPYLPMGRTTDILRFQLPALVWACIGVGALAPHLTSPRRRAAAAVAALTTLLALRPQGGSFAHQVEHAAALEAFRALPDDTVVLYRDDLDPDGTWARWTAVVADVRLRAAAPEAPGDLVWVGRADRVVGTPLDAGCTGTVLAEGSMPPHDGGVVALGTTDVPWRLVRVTACGSAER